MTDHENVLRDLLLECGVDGVTLWHIRALAVALKSSNDRPFVRGELARIIEDRFFWDMRGEEAVLSDAYAQWSLEMQPAWEAPAESERNGYGDCDHEFIATPEGEVCVRCGGIPPRTPGEYETDDRHEPYDPHYLDQD